MISCLRLDIEQKASTFNNMQERIQACRTRKTQTR